MIALFKKRRFNDYLNDTFEFFKKDGKHFFGGNSFMDSPRQVKK
jgi:hypothetical protein